MSKRNNENAQSMLTFSELSSRSQIDQLNPPVNKLSQSNSQMMGSNLFSKSFAIQQKGKNSQTQMLVGNKINSNNMNSNYTSPKKMLSQLSTGIEEKNNLESQSKPIHKNQNTMSSFFSADLNQESLLVKKYSQKLLRQQSHYTKLRDTLQSNPSKQVQNIKQLLENSLRNQYILEKELIRLKKAVLYQQNSDIHNNKKSADLNIDSIISIKVCPTKRKIFHKKQESHRQKRYQTWDNRFFNI